MTQQNLYQVLMVDPRADMGVITVVYHTLAKRYHPDRAMTTDADRRMAELNTAYATLGDPARREQYDRSIGISNGGSGRADLVAVRIETDGGQVPQPGASSNEAASLYGEAGQPPAYPAARGSVLTFGRYQGWAISQIDARDRNYLEWLRRTPTGRMYTKELDAILGANVAG